MVYFVNFLNKVDKYVLKLQNRVVKYYRPKILKRNLNFKDSEAVQTSCLCLHDIDFGSAQNSN